LHHEVPDEAQVPRVHRNPVHTEHPAHLAGVRVRVQGLACIGFKV
jgi:hypothetical protein